MPPSLQYLTSPQGRKIAYHHAPKGPLTVVFLGGFRSDMQGTKAVHLEQWASTYGCGFMRFDYSGHGLSGEAFTDGSIGDWREDAQAILSLITGPIILVGSSMGGWISLLIARQAHDNIVGLVGVAAAPDFTADSMWESLSSHQRDLLHTQGQVAIPSEYGDDYIITKRLIEDGRDNLVLRTPLSLHCPARFLQGTQDTAVDTSVALKLLEHVQGDDIQLTLVQGANHSFSDTPCLRVIERAVEDLIDGHNASNL